MARGRTLLGDKIVEFVQDKGCCEKEACSTQKHTCLRPEGILTFTLKPNPNFRKFFWGVSKPKKPVQLHTVTHINIYTHIQLPTRHHLSPLSFSFSIIPYSMMLWSLLLLRIPWEVSGGIQSLWGKKYIQYNTILIGYSLVFLNVSNLGKVSGNRNGPTVSRLCVYDLNCFHIFL